MNNTKYTSYQRGSVAEVLLGVIALIFLALVSVGGYYVYQYFASTSDQDCRDKYTNITYNTGLNIFYSKSISKCVLYAVTPDRSNPDSPKTDIRYADPVSRDLYKVDTLDGNIPDKDMASYVKKQFEAYASK